MSEHGNQSIFAALAWCETSWQADVGPLNLSPRCGQSFSAGGIINKIAHKMIID